MDARAVLWRRWAQEAVVGSGELLLGSLSEPWFTGFRFPMIEDLINQSPFIDYAEWRSGQHLDWDGPLGPATAPAGVRIRSRTAEGQQAGALSHKAALPPLISGVPNPDDHFAAALAMKMTPTPLEQEAVMDEDLQFVASVMAARRGDLRQMRRGAVGAVKELKQRWKRVDDQLRQFQAPALQAVTAQRDIGLLGLLVILLAWPDVSYPMAWWWACQQSALPPTTACSPSNARRITFEEVSARAS